MLSLLKAPGPDTGAWPTPAFSAATTPQVVLWPEETTYPPDVAELLAGRHTQRVAAEVVFEVITDGERMWLAQRSSTGRR